MSGRYTRYYMQELVPARLAADDSGKTVTIPGPTKFVLADFETTLLYTLYASSGCACLAVAQSLYVGEIEPTRIAAWAAMGAGAVLLATPAGDVLTWAFGGAAQAVRAAFEPRVISEWEERDGDPPVADVPIMAQTRQYRNGGSWAFYKPPEGVLYREVQSLARCVRASSYERFSEKACLSAISGPKFRRVQEQFIALEYAQKLRNNAVVLTARGRAVVRAIAETPLPHPEGPAGG